MDWIKNMAILTIFYRFTISNIFICAVLDSVLSKVDVYVTLVN